MFTGLYTGIVDKMKRCDRCQGMKRVDGMGGMKERCPKCKGVGLLDEEKKKGK